MKGTVADTLGIDPFLVAWKKIFLLINPLKQ